MISNSYASSSLNNFDFKFKTSSGDEINLSMYDNKSLEYKKQSDKNTQTSELTLSRHFGYKFEFKSNGLSQQDKSEIAKALEDIAPKIDEFIKQTNENTPFSNDAITNLANSIKKDLPQIKNENQKNAISSSVLDLFDNLLKQNKANEKTLQSSKNLFDEILKQLQSFSIYA
ncbi:ATP/GTP-binding protein [Campylobacter hyointestinalis subsp. hyointestinalis]|uniref:ATP/GTP-binding protein n=1 Tax=Campylobacter hyointestinalis TaxID=198 RepID=UPI000CE322FE|nr:ATP/GTP-binding protein [Campylobacter hyointestinalis]PPB57220.1 ATP/GTP-binding protein [Campylobacter hyointestinalis subsp. hyointestinalis]QCU00279.1 ATP/GTP-binding protein [Campylobacter hyointestinalis subsp. hyointestinalis]